MIALHTRTNWRRFDSQTCIGGYQHRVLIAVLRVPIYHRQNAIPLGTYVGDVGATDALNHGDSLSLTTNEDTYGVATTASLRITRRQK